MRSCHSVFVLLYSNVFDKCVGLSGRKTIMEAWNAQYALCLAYFDFHCFWWENLWRFHKIFLSPPQVSRLAEWRLQCYTCHSHWSVVRRSRNPRTRHLAANQHVHCTYSPQAQGHDQPACENLHISLHSHRPAHLAADANCQFPTQTTHDSAHVTMSQCHNVTMSHIQKFLRRIQSKHFHKNFVSGEREEKAW